MKKIVVIAMSLALILIFASCDAARISSTLNITSRDGAGTKEIVVDVLSDTTKIPDGAYAGSDVGNNSKFLLKTGNELVTFLKSKCKLADAVITSEKLADRERITIKYSFKSISDYNTKTKALADGKAIVNATIAVSGDNVTFTENPSNTKSSIDTMLKAVYDDTSVYDKTGKGDMGTSVVTFDQMAEVYKVKYTVATASKEVNIKDMKDFGDEIVPVSVTGTIKAAVQSTTTSNVDNSPNTGDSNTVAMVSLMLLSIAALAFVAVKKVSCKSN